VTHAWASVPACHPAVARPAERPASRRNDGQTQNTACTCDLWVTYIAQARWKAASNRIKMIKRIMYGQANPDLLRILVLHGY
jgi:hypothetical protein